MYKKPNVSKKDMTKIIFEETVKKLQSIIDNGDYERFLKFQKNFRKYSFMNLIAIFYQFPDATMVAGKSTWLKLKREVLDTAQKIYILAPIPHKCSKKIKKIENGIEIEETINYQYNTYRKVFVYDISQTKGEPIPLASKDIDSSDMAYFYETLKCFSQVPVIEKELEGSVKGYYCKSSNEIAIKNTLSPNDKAAVLLHEIAHSLYDDFDYSKDRHLSEVFVESIAYIVANYFGLDTSSCSFTYIIKWAKGETQTVIDLGSKIQKCANNFIHSLEHFELDYYKKLVA